MRTMLNLTDRLIEAAVTYEKSDIKSDRDELHAARRAIVEREAELVQALRCAVAQLEAHGFDGEASGAYAALHPKPVAAE